MTDDTERSDGDVLLDTLRQHDHGDGVTVERVRSMFRHWDTDRLERTLNRLERDGHIYAPNEAVWKVV